MRVQTARKIKYNILRQKTAINESKERVRQETERPSDLLAVFNQDKDHVVFMPKKTKEDDMRMTYSKFYSRPKTSIKSKKLSCLDKFIGVTYEDD